MEEEFYGPAPKPIVKPWLLIVFLGVLVVGLAYWGWRIYQKQKKPAISNRAVIVNTAQNDTSEKWGSYENLKYGFSIKIPSSYVSLKSQTCKPDKVIDPNASSLLLGVNCVEFINIDISKSTVSDWFLARKDTSGWAIKDTTIGQDNNVAAKSIILTKANPYKDYSSLMVFENNGFLFEFAENNNRLLLSEMLANINFDKVSNPAVATQLKTYTDNQHKIQFQYPGTWKDITLNPITFTPSDYDKGKGYSSSFKDGSTEILTYDPDAAFSFSIYSKDYARFPFGAVSPAKVDLTWKRQDFIDNMKFPVNILGYKQLGKNALLVLSHSDYECSASFGADVYVPTSNPDYPNFIISINLLSTASDPIIKEYLDKQQQDGKDLCNTEEPYQAIADKIIADTYNDKLKAEIEMVRKIADSFKNL